MRPSGLRNLTSRRCTPGLRSARGRDGGGEDKGLCRAQSWKEKSGGAAAGWGAPKEDCRRLLHLVLHQEEGRSGKAGGDCHRFPLLAPPPPRPRRQRRRRMGSRRVAPAPALVQRFCRGYEARDSGSTSEDEHDDEYYAQRHHIRAAGFRTAGFRTAGFRTADFGAAGFEAPGCCHDRGRSWWR